jgi:hypothetical protein
MNSEYTRALVDAANAAEAEAKEWDERRRERLSDGGHWANVCDERYDVLMGFAKRLRAWAKATPTPPPDAGERNDLRTFLTIRREAFTDDPSMLSMIDGMLRHIAQPSPPPPAGGEREAIPQWGEWRCSECGELNDDVAKSSAWRWTGERWEHWHEVVGHVRCKRVSPPPAPQGDDVADLARKHNVSVEWVKDGLEWDRNRVGAPGCDVRRRAAFLLDVIALRANGRPR